MEIINKVAQSGLITINLEELFPVEDIQMLDIKPWLYEELILKEKDFREYVKQHDWQLYNGKVAGVTCSADAIIPTWAYMLIGVHLAPVAREVFFGTRKEIEEKILDRQLTSFDATQFTGQRIVIKGCANRDIPVSTYLGVTKLLQPHVKSIMYGEACSTVPLYKRKD